MNLIKKLRRELDLTQGQLAEKANISRSLLSSIENDINRLTDETCDKLAKALNVSREYLKPDQIDRPNDFGGTVNILREYQYINTGRVINLLQSTGTMLAEEISTTLMNQNVNSLGVDKIIKAGNSKDTSSSVNAKLKKTVYNYTTELLNYLERNNLVLSNLPSEINQFDRRAFYSNGFEIKLTDFNEAINRIGEIFKLAKYFPSDDNTDFDEIEQMLNIVIGTTQYLTTDSTQYKVLIKIDPNLLTANSLSDLEGDSIVVYKAPKIIDPESNLSLLSSDFSKIASLSDQDKAKEKLYKSFEELGEKLSINLDRSAMEVKGPIVVIDPIIIYK